MLAAVIEETLVAQGCTERKSRSLPTRPETSVALLGDDTFGRGLEGFGEERLGVEMLLFDIGVEDHG
jgi:hypothetical protein